MCRASARILQLQSEPLVATKPQVAFRTPPTLNCSAYSVPDKYCNCTAILVPIREAEPVSLGHTKPSQRPLRCTAKLIAHAETGSSSPHSLPVVRADSGASRPPHRRRAGWTTPRPLVFPKIAVQCIIYCKIICNHCSASPS